MLLTYVEQHRAADEIKHDFPVIRLALRLVRIWERDTQCLERFVLRGLYFPVLVHHIEDMPFMDVRSCFVQMQRPVQDVYISAEAFFKFQKII